MKQIKELKLHLNALEQETYYQSLDEELKTIELELDEQSSLELLIYNSNCTLQASVQKDASLKIYNIVFTNNLSLATFNIDINASGASVNVINVYLGVQEAKLTSNIYINHHAPQAKSLLETYAISLDKAVMVLNNNAKIDAGMHGSDARQMTKGLNLGSGSITAKPNLYIDEYDVIASHSASIGSIDQEELFYLMSRGLSITEATEIITLGFIRPLLSQIKDLKLQEKIYSKFIEYLK